GLLDALTIRRVFGRIEGLTIAICGDVRHSRVTGSNLKLLPMLGAKVRLVAPPALMRTGEDGAERFDDFGAGIAGADVVMMLRLQKERMEQALIPSSEAYFRDWGLDRDKLKLAAPDVRVMHPGPMNRGVEIASDVADDASISLIRAQVANGVAVRMAVLACLAERRKSA
ncbi:MAG: aspartate carbamoyltransferase catalytic subunit, partial [Caulobacteraceae bacterium]